MCTNKVIVAKVEFDANQDDKNPQKKNNTYCCFVYFVHKNGTNANELFCTLR